MRRGDRRAAGGSSEFTNASDGENMERLPGTDSHRLFLD